MGMKKIIILNHKMNLLYDDLIPYIMKLNEIQTENNIIVCPSNIYLESFINYCDWGIGSQNVSINSSKNNTGGVSSIQLKSLGVEYSMVGHSDLGENDTIINGKVLDLLDNNIIPILCLNDDEKKVNDLYEKILLNDIILRNKIRNETALRMTFKRLAENVTKPVAYNRIANLIKSTGTSTSPASIIQYVEFAKDAYVILSIENYASKFVEKETVKKHYFIDNGLLSIFLTETVAPLFENLCAVYLYRKYDDGLYFYGKSIEVDFYVPGEKYAVQACVSLKDKDTEDREVKALVKLDQMENLDRMQIITLEEEATITLPNGKTIEILPAWKWLLEVTCG